MTYDSPEHCGQRMTSVPTGDQRLRWMCWCGAELTETLAEAMQRSKREREIGQANFWLAQHRQEEKNK